MSNILSIDLIYSEFMSILSSSLPVEIFSASAELIDNTRSHSIVSTAVGKPATLVRILLASTFCCRSLIPFIRKSFNVQPSFWNLLLILWEIYDI